MRAVLLALLLAACVPDPHVGHTCRVAFLDEDVFVIRKDVISDSFVTVRRKTGRTMQMGRNELGECR